jgi:hypothetical protein
MRKRKRKRKKEHMLKQLISHLSHLFLFSSSSASSSSFLYYYYYYYCCYYYSEPLENLTILLFLFVVTCLPKLAYDTNLVALVRRKDKDGIDGGPLIAGIVTILKQFHPSCTLQFFGYLGQFTRSTLDFVLSDVKLHKNGMPYEVRNALIFMDQFSRFAEIPSNVLHSFVPRSVFETVGIA